jgi:hypothetical protein
MKRRTCLTATMAGLAGLKGATAQTPKNPIVLHVDLSVEPSKEQEMLRNYHTVFLPAATKHPGFIDLKMLKLRQALQGSAPAGVNYRFQLTYESEELRQKWVASDVHKRVWPTIENTLRSKDYVVLLFDSV